MFQLLEEEKIASTPYSPLAAGRVCRMWEGDSKRAELDKGGKRKYDGNKDKDYPIVERIKEVADKMKISMAQVSLAWMFSKPLVASPVIGCTKISQLEELCAAVKIKLSDEDIKYLEELYQPHATVGALKKGDLAFGEKKK